jgi:small GTP-binding protein
MSGVGKDDILNILAENRFATNYKLTVGVEILSKDIEYKSGEVATLSIWDIGGQQRFEFIRPTFYKGASGALLTFDLSREQTLSEVRKWLKEIFQYTGKIPFLLIGNNIRLEKDSLTNREKIQDLVKSQGGIYIETNPENFKIIDEALYGLIDQILLMRTKNHE